MALRDLLSLKKTTPPEDIPLPEVAEFDYKEDCEYVMVPASQVTRCKLEGFTPVARSITNADGTMLVLERKRV
jgi:hypothetical protein